MACFVKLFLIFFSLDLLINETFSHHPTLPKSAVLPLVKDSLTLQYVTQLFMGENMASVKAVVDLGGPFLWLNCEDSSVFSPNRRITSCSLQCSMAESSGCVRDSKTCTVQAENGVSNISSSGGLFEDRFDLKFENSGTLASIDNLLFSCAPTSLLKGLAKGAQGMLGLGNSRISLSSQFSTAFGFFHRRFSMCLSSSSIGAIFLGGNPFETGNLLIYTPLISKKNSMYYHINVNSIRISGKKLSLNTKGFDGGTKISTIIPYTTMESKIYRTFVGAYIKAAMSMNLTLVAAVAPFEDCFTSNQGETKRVVPNVPIIDFVLQSELVKWRIHGKNSMVRISDEVFCLGFMDGGLNQRGPIVIGGHQLEDYILEFNLGNSMLGFSSSLAMGNKKCSDFDVSIATDVS